MSHKLLMYTRTVYVHNDIIKLLLSLLLLLLLLLLYTLVPTL
jgi:hypothetical protein